MSDQEIFKPVEGFPDFRVSNLGKVERRKGDCWKSRGTTAGEGYIVVTLSNRETGETKRITVHRLVAKHFLEEPAAPYNQVVRHLDGNNRHNAASNLAWGSHDENCADRASHHKPADMSGFPKLFCVRCGNTWVPRVENVKQCPKCHSRHWNKPRAIREPQPAAILSKQKPY